MKRWRRHQVAGPDDVAWIMMGIPFRQVWKAWQGRNPLILSLDRGLRGTQLAKRYTREGRMEHSCRRKKMRVDLNLTESRFRRIMRGHAQASTGTLVRWAALTGYPIDEMIGDYGIWWSFKPERRGDGRGIFGSLGEEDVDGAAPDEAGEGGEGLDPEAPGLLDGVCSLYRASVGDRAADTGQFAEQHPSEEGGVRFWYSGATFRRRLERLARGLGEPEGGQREGDGGDVRAGQGYLREICESLNGGRSEEDTG